MVITKCNIDNTDIDILARLKIDWMSRIRNRIIILDLFTKYDTVCAVEHMINTFCVWNVDFQEKGGGQDFFLGDWGPLSSEDFVNPPTQHQSPFLDKGLSPPSRGSSLKIWKI